MLFRVFGKDVLLGLHLHEEPMAFGRKTLRSRPLLLGETRAKLTHKRVQHANPLCGKTHKHTLTRLLCLFFWKTFNQKAQKAIISSLFWTRLIWFTSKHLGITTFLRWLDHGVYDCFTQMFWHFPGGSLSHSKWINLLGFSFGEAAKVAWQPGQVVKILEVVGLFWKHWMHGLFNYLYHTN